MREKMDVLIFMSFEAQTTKNPMSKCDVMTLIEHLCILNNSRAVLDQFHKNKNYIGFDQYYYQNLLDWNFLK